MPEEGTLPGLLELLTHEFNAITGYIDAIRAGETLVIRPTEPASEELLEEIECFLTEHGARYTRLTEQTGPGPQTTANTTFRIVLDEDDVSWNTNRDERIDYQVNVDKNGENGNDAEHGDLILFNQPAKRLETGAIDTPGTPNNESFPDAHIASIELTHVETLTPQPKGLKYPPTVTIVEWGAPDEAITTHEFTTYDAIRATDDTVHITMGDREITFTNAAIQNVAERLADTNPA